MTNDPFATIAGIIPSFEDEDDAALTEICLLYTSDAADDM
jgi:hypothetical protein